MAARNASAVPALIVSTKMKGLDGAASVVMAVTNVPGTPGRGKVVVEAPPPSPPTDGPKSKSKPSKFSSGSAATALKVSVPDARRRRLQEVRRVLGEKDSNGPKCATSYVPSSNAGSDGSCLPAYSESMACELVPNDPMIERTHPYTVHRTPYTVHRTPYTLHRTPYTLTL